MFKIKSAVELIKLLVVLFLFFALGRFLSVIIDIYFLPNEPLRNTQTVSLNSPPFQTKSISEFSDLILGNLLNTEPAPPGSLEISPGGATSLDGVELSGVLVWTNKSLAVISYQGAISVVLQGAEIPSTSITLEKVERSRVLIVSAGLERWVEISRRKSGSSFVSANNSQPPAANTPLPSGGIELLPINDNRQSVVVSRQRVESELENFAKFINQARVFPHFKDGKPDGYVIRNIEPGSIFSQLGLKDEDIIRTVNGQTIDSPERAFELFKLLRNENRVMLTLSRAERPLDFEFNIN